MPSLSRAPNIAAMNASTYVSRARPGSSGSSRRAAASSKPLPPVGTHALAVTDHAAQRRTPHTGPAVITGTEDRQHAYVTLTRGTNANLAYVFTAVLPWMHDRMGQAAARAAAARHSAGRGARLPVRRVRTRVQALRVRTGIARAAEACRSTGAPQAG